MEIVLTLPTPSAAEKDVLGTLGVSLGVAFIFLFHHNVVKGYNRWITNTALIYGLVFTHWKTRCHLEQSDNEWFVTVHDALCWKNMKIDYWTQREHGIVYSLAWLAILANVVPAYIYKKEAQRHLIHVKKRFWNPLINHIIAGILCVTIPSAIVYFEARKLAWLGIVVDMYHQITCHRLISNHDGIWHLRALTMAHANAKFFAILGLYEADPFEMLQQTFLLSCGFLGTRIISFVTVVILYFNWPGQIVLEHWYSFGIFGTSIWIFGRMWGSMRLVFGLTLVNCAATHFHQLWKAHADLRTPFVLSCVLVTTVMCHTPFALSAVVAIGFVTTGFFLPRFKRQDMQRQASAAYFENPVRTISRAGKDLSRAISSTLSRACSMTRPGDMSAEAIRKKYFPKSKTPTSQKKPPAGDSNREASNPPEEETKLEDFPNDFEFTPRADFGEKLSVPGGSPIRRISLYKEVTTIEADVMRRSLSGA